MAPSSSADWNEWLPSLLWPGPDKQREQVRNYPKENKEQNHKKMFFFKENVSAADDLMWSNNKWLTNCISVDDELTTSPPPPQTLGLTCTCCLILQIWTRKLLVTWSYFCWKLIEILADVIKVEDIFLVFWWPWKEEGRKKRLFYELLAWRAGRINYRFIDLVSRRPSFFCWDKTLVN